MQQAEVDPLHLTAAFATMIILPLQYAKAATYADPLTARVFNWQPTDPNSISNSMISVTGTQLLNQKDITLGDIGGTFTPAGNQLYIGGIAIIENDMLFADTYSPEIAQNNADYMRQIIGIANSL